MLNILTAVVNNPIFIEIQNFTLKKYMKTPYRFVVFNDAKQQQHNNSRFISFVMKCFHLLFKFNLFNSQLGWTVLAKAKWEG